MFSSSSINANGIGKMVFYGLLVATIIVAVVMVSKSTTDTQMDSRQIRTSGYIDPMIENFYTPNKYTKQCGACLPTEGNPNIWTRKCTIKNSDGYNVGQYTTESTCVVCEDTGNRIKSCQTYDEEGQYVGETKQKIGMSFCSS